ERASLERRIKELEAAKAEIEQQVKWLTAMLAQETESRKRAEQQANDSGQQRVDLEAELAKNKEAQATLQQELEALQKQLQAQETSWAEQVRLETRINESLAAKAALQQQLDRLRETLAEQSKRLETVQQEAAETGKQRSELEARLAESKQAQA